MESLNELFELEKIEKKEIITPIQQKQNLNIDDPMDAVLLPDFKTSRNNIDAIMEMGRSALEKILTIADEGQHPRFYEAAAILIKNLSDANFQYIELHEKVSRIRKNNADSGHGQLKTNTINIDKAVFTGTTADLLKQINPRKPIEVKTIDIEDTNDAI